MAKAKAAKTGKARAKKAAAVKDLAPKSAKAVAGGLIRYEQNSDIEWNIGRRKT